MDVAVAGSIEWTDVKKRIVADGFDPAMMDEIVNRDACAQVLTRYLPIMSAPWHKNPVRSLHGFY
jgi:hypothetical protein